MSIEQRTAGEQVLNTEGFTAYSIQTAVPYLVGLSLKNVVFQSSELDGTVSVHVEQAVNALESRGGHNS